MVRKAWKRIASKCLAAFLAFQTACCGTLIHPERRGQSATGRLDPAIVLLDAVGLLVFFVPGIIAFAVDFTTGAIYLPPDRFYASSRPDGQSLQIVQANPSELTSQRLEAILCAHTGQSVRLKPGTYRATKINQIQDFTPKAMSNWESSPAANVIFRGTAE